MSAPSSAELPTLQRPDVDPRLWLEEVEGRAALDWVRKKNEHVVDALGDPKASPVYERIMKILDSKEKIPYIGRVLNGLYYNFWIDSQHRLGIWRRCTLEEYRKESPKWETVLDLDALSKEEGITWVWSGSIVLNEGPNVPTDRVLIKLSDAGADANHVREFDVTTKKFVPALEGGFVLPESKVNVGWKDRDTLIVGGSIFGPDAVTDSGYARTSREWKRGTPLSSAMEVFAGMKTDVQCGSYTYLQRGFRVSMTYRHPSFYDEVREVRLGPEGFGADAFARGYRKVGIPKDAQLSVFAGQALITLRSEWLGFAAGSMLAGDVTALLGAQEDAAALKPLLTPLFTPTPTTSLEDTSESQSYLILQVLDNVRCELRFWRWDGGKGGKGGKAPAWTMTHTMQGENYAEISVHGVNDDKTDAIWMTTSSFTQPTTYSLSHADTPKASQEKLKALPTFFDASNLVTRQFEATSEDGTKVPYFLIMRKDAKLDGSTPTLLYGYGGFEISMTPYYSAVNGVGWLEKGYAYALANIRGGGEFGPQWHQAALLEKRHKAYEDFEAVARDLVVRGVANADRIGVEGGSNGGLLTGNMITRKPELFGAIVSSVPLLDMRRYHLLLAGASWMAEFGNPAKPDEWRFLQHNSPYHVLRPGGRVPPTLFTTSTRDDRVHPGHARKLAGKMYDLGMPVLSYENIEGGHGGAADNKQRAYMCTLTFAFLEKSLAGEQTLASTLAARPPSDGGCRTFANWLYRVREVRTAGLHAARAQLGALPAWVAPALSTALALGVIVALQRRRLG